MNSPALARYTRCSAIPSRSGRKLEEGARTARNQIIPSTVTGWERRSRNPRMHHEDKPGDRHPRQRIGKPGHVMDRVHDRLTRTATRSIRRSAISRWPASTHSGRAAAIQSKTRSSPAIDRLRQQQTRPAPESRTPTASARGPRRRQDEEASRTQAERRGAQEPFPSTRPRESRRPEPPPLARLFQRESHRVLTAARR